MLVEITNTSLKDGELNKWYLIHKRDGELNTGIYVNFRQACGLDGTILYTIPGGGTVIVDMEYGGVNYP